MTTADDHSLADLVPGERGIVTGFQTTGPLVQRLMHLGVIEGQAFTVIRTAPMGDPIEIEILGYRLSLRRSEACAVSVSPLCI